MPQYIETLQAVVQSFQQHPDMKTLVKYKTSEQEITDVTEFKETLRQENPEPLPGLSTGPDEAIPQQG